MKSIAAQFILKHAAPTSCVLEQGDSLIARFAQPPKLVAPVVHMRHEAGECALAKSVRYEDLDFVPLFEEAEIQRTQIAIVANSKKAHGRRLGRRSPTGLESKFVAVPRDRASSVPQPHDSSLTDRARAPRVFFDQRMKNLAIPRLRVLHVEDGMNSEIMPVFGFDPDSLQTFVDVSGAGRRR